MVQEQISSGTATEWGCEQLTVGQMTGPRPALSVVTFGSQKLGDTKITKWQISSRIWQKGHYSFICDFLFGCNSLTLCSSYGKCCYISYLGVEVNGKGNVCWTYRKIEWLCLYNGPNNLFHLANFPSIAIFVSKDIKCCWKVLRFYQNRTLL